MKALISILVAVAVASGVYSYDEYTKESEFALAWPLPDGVEREKKLTFGLFVTPNPEKNPIDPPERFIGYHTALDLEILPDEVEKEVPVLASCDGRIIQTGAIEGYGGVVIQACQVKGEDVTVLYGHLDYNAFQKKAGDQVNRGEELGVLGDAKSAETGQTRKHLHFGVHKGTEIEMRGYVQQKSELDQFIDPLTLLQ